MAKALDQIRVNFTIDKLAWTWWAKSPDSALYDSMIYE